ncbi:helix-turn-helix domain-containing protein [Lysinibacillus sp. MHQ-1]|nr:helix-turn-helix domain-containing protein [Lysinibacillus sp. MHQ-1]
MSQEQSYTIEEVAQLLKVSKLTVYDLVKKRGFARFPSRTPNAGGPY